MKVRNDGYDYVYLGLNGPGQRHLHGLVGFLWRIKDPSTVRIGHCFMSGRLKEGDLWLGVSHSGDCFQTYMFVEEYSNALKGVPAWTFGSYGIGDAEPVPLNDGDFETLSNGGQVPRNG